MQNYFITKDGFNKYHVKEHIWGLGDVSIASSKSLKESIIYLNKLKQGEVIVYGERK